MTKKINLRTTLLGVACLALGAIFFLNMGAAKNEPETHKPALPRMVKAIILQTADVKETRSFPGLTKASYAADLAFRVGGPLIEMEANIGEHVDKGEVIARLDPRDFKLAVGKLEAAISEAEASLSAMRKGARVEDIVRLEAGLDAARAQREEAESNFIRHERLYEQNAIAKAAYDSAKATFNTAQAQVVSAQKALEIGRKGARKEDLEAMESRIQSLKTDLQKAENALTDAVLYAPSEGAIYKKYVENFEHVAPGQPIISLLNMSVIEVQTAIPQILITRLDNRPGFTCTIEAYPGKTFRARLKEIGKNTEGRGLSYPLTVVVDVPDGLEVLPGMAASVNISLDDSEHKEQGLSVPVSALFADAAGRPCVWRVNKSDMTVEKAPVEEGAVIGDHVQIKEGVAPGEMVVTAGARFLLEGQQIRLTESSKGTMH